MPQDAPFRCLLVAAAFMVLFLISTPPDSSLLSARNCRSRNLPR